MACIWAPSAQLSPQMSGRGLRPAEPCFWCPSVICSVVFLIAALILALLQGWALVLSFPWLLSDLSLKQSHGILLLAFVLAIIIMSLGIFQIVSFLLEIIHLAMFLPTFMDNCSFISYFLLCDYSVALCYKKWLLIKETLHVISPQGQMVQMRTVTLSAVCREWKL